jgi:hypothetical protein
MDAFQFRKLDLAPEAADMIAVYHYQTTNLVPSLVSLNGAPIDNPFSVTQAGGKDHWGFYTTTAIDVDIYWMTKSIYLAKCVNTSVEASIVDGGVFT